MAFGCGARSGRRRRSGMALEVGRTECPVLGDQRCGTNSEYPMFGVAPMPSIDQSAISGSWSCSGVNVRPFEGVALDSDHGHDLSAQEFQRFQLKKA